MKSMVEFLSVVVLTVGACYAEAPPLAFLAPRTLEDMGVHFTFIIGVLIRAFNFL